jgi:hypothetical protein
MPFQADGHWSSLKSGVARFPGDFDLAQCGQHQPTHNYPMDFRLAVLLMVGIALTYVLAPMLWHRRQR